MWDTEFRVYVAAGTQTARWAITRRGERPPLVTAGKALSQNDIVCRRQSAMIMTGQP